MTDKAKREFKFSMIVALSVVAVIFYCAELRWHPVVTLLATGCVLLAPITFFAVNVMLALRGYDLIAWFRVVATYAPLQKKHTRKLIL